MRLARTEFERLRTEGYNQIPLIDRIPIDGLTPTALLSSLGDAGDRILLESTRVSPDSGRYSIVVMDAFDKFVAKGNRYTVGGEAHDGDPMAALRQLMRRYQGYRPAGAPLFCGGAIGYFAYECNRYFEKLPIAHDDLAIPDIYLIITSSLVVFDHVADELLLVASGDDYDACADRLGELSERVGRAKAAWSATEITIDEAAVELARWGSNFSREAYEAAVGRVQEYIRSGDVYQVNLSQRLEVPTTGGIDLYRTLSRLNPVHFASYLDLDGFEIVSASPERLVRLENGRLFTRPIAGTRRRGTEMEDARFIHELKTDIKEVSEHTMLVDLERNDLGRVSKFGSVKVEKLMDIVKYARVIHIESEVVGALADDKDWVDVIEAMFPGGTITGMPKIRTMEIIAELEPNARGIYTGSIGYVSFTGETDLNIVIRTILVKDGTAYVNVGGGVVWDSNPPREYKETLNKARSALLALNAGGTPC